MALGLSLGGVGSVAGWSLCRSHLCYRVQVFRLPDNCAPYLIIYIGAQLSGSGAQLSGPGAQLSGPGAQLSAILVCIPTYVISAPLCMYVRYCSSIYMSQPKA